MDLIKIGKFIAEKRKSLKLTQLQLAETLNISEKTVSKWECGHGFPDTSLILPLCEVLKISANELLSGKSIKDDKEYIKNAENNILELTNQEIYKNKLLLSLEWIIGYFSVLVLLTFAFVAKYTTMPDVWKIILIVFGFINCIIGVFFALKIEKDAGYYECGKCHHKHIPTYKQILWSIHIGRTRHLKCPKCGQKSWNKKTIK